MTPESARHTSMSESKQSSSTKISALETCPAILLCCDYLKKLKSPITYSQSVFQAVQPAMITKICGSLAGVRQKDERYHQWFEILNFKEKLTREKPALWKWRLIFRWCHIWIANGSMPINNSLKSFQLIRYAPVEWLEKIHGRWVCILWSFNFNLLSLIIAPVTVVGLK